MLGKRRGISFRKNNMYHMVDTNKRKNDIRVVGIFVNAAIL